VSVSPFSPPNVIIPVDPDPELVKLLYDLEFLRGSWRADLLRCDQYFRGEQPLKFMSDARA
jgi:hypothetical protein